MRNEETLLLSLGWGFHADGSTGGSTVGSDVFVSSVDDRWRLETLGTPDEGMKEEGGKVERDRKVESGSGSAVCWWSLIRIGR